MDEIDRNHLQEMTFYIKIIHQKKFKKIGETGCGFSMHVTKEFILYFILRMHEIH